MNFFRALRWEEIRQTYPFSSAASAEPLRGGLFLTHAAPPFRSCESLREIRVPEKTDINSKAFKDSPTQIIRY